MLYKYYYLCRAVWQPDGYSFNNGFEVAFCDLKIK